MRFTPGNMLSPEGVVEPFVGGEVLYDSPEVLRCSDRTLWPPEFREMYAEAENQALARGLEPTLLVAPHCLSWTTSGCDYDGIISAKALGVSSHPDRYPQETIENLRFLEHLHNVVNAQHGKSRLGLRLFWATTGWSSTCGVSDYECRAIDPLLHTITNRLGLYYPYLDEDSSITATNAACLREVRASLFDFENDKFVSAPFLARNKFHNLPELMIAKTVELLLDPNRDIKLMDHLEQAFVNLQRPDNHHLLLLFLGYLQDPVALEPAEEASHERRVLELSLRAGWGFTRPQRQAICSSLACSPGQINLVNGRPGSDKSRVLMASAILNTSQRGKHKKALIATTGLKRAQALVEEHSKLTHGNMDNCIYVCNEVDVTAEMVQPYAILVTTLASAPFQSIAGNFGPTIAFFDDADRLNDLEMVALVASLSSVRQYNLYGDRNRRATGDINHEFAWQSRLPVFIRVQPGNLHSKGVRQIYKTCTDRCSTIWNEIRSSNGLLRLHNVDDKQAEGEGFVDANSHDRAVKSHPPGPGHFKQSGDYQGIAATTSTIVEVEDNLSIASSLSEDARGYLEVRERRARAEENVRRISADMARLKAGDYDRMT